MRRFALLVALALCACTSLKSQPQPEPTPQPGFAHHYDSAHPENTAYILNCHGFRDKHLSRMYAIAYTKGDANPTLLVMLSTKGPLYQCDAAP